MILRADKKPQLTPYPGRRYYRANKRAYYLLGRYEPLRLFLLALTKREYYYNEHKQRYATRLESQHEVR